MDLENLKQNARIASTVKLDASIQKTLGIGPKDYDTLRFILKNLFISMLEISERRDDGEDSGSGQGLLEESLEVNELFLKDQLQRLESDKTELLMAYILFRAVDKIQEKGTAFDYGTLQKADPVKAKELVAGAAVVSFLPTDEVKKLEKLSDWALGVVKDKMTVSKRKLFEVLLKTLNEER